MARPGEYSDAEIAEINRELRTMFAYTFNARNVAPSQPNDPVPADWYTGYFEEMKQVPVKNTTQGEWFAEGTFLITQGQYQGRRVKQPRLNLHNSNEKAREIAGRELSAICHAVNVFDLQNMGQLCGPQNTLQMKLIVEDGYNSCKGYKAANGNDPGRGQPQQAPAFQPPQQQPAAFQPQAPAGFQQAPVQQPQPVQQPAFQPQQPAGQPQWQQPQQQQPAQQPQFAPQQPQQGFQPPAQGGQQPSWGR